MVVSKSSYYHPGQQRTVLAGVKTEDIVCGRGWGKSEGPGAKRTSDWANNMPRASIGIVGSSYMQLLDRTLPPLYAGWERLGYRRGVHYFPRQKPPKALGIPLPIYAPDTDQNTIYWWNGACFKLISQDRPGSANGTSLDALYGDEAKLLNKKKFDDEISKANRGNLDEFGDYAGHHGILFMTDMPTVPEAKWILERKTLMDTEIEKGSSVIKMYELVEYIINYQLYINQLLTKRFNETNPEKLQKLNRLIRSAERKINELRRNSYRYTEGSSLENVYRLGLDTLKDWKRDDLDHVFRTQVLNEQLYQVTNSFYPDFDTAIHCADDSYNYSYIDALGLFLPKGLIKDSRMDADVVTGRPLDLAFDAGARINCLVVGQEHPTVYKFLKSMYVKKPKLITDLVTDFCDYYAHHQCKEVNFHYDHTFNGTDGTRLFTYADTITKALIKRGWKVNRIDIGQQPGHATRYRMWGEVFQEFTERVKPVRFNRNNCAQLIICVQLAGALEGSKGVEKDKRPERRLNVPQEEATHLTDAMDTLYIGKFQTKLGYSTPKLDAFGI